MEKFFQNVTFVNIKNKKIKTREKRNLCKHTKNIFKQIFFNRSFLKVETREKHM